MYKQFTESRKNKKTSASNDELNNESTTNESDQKSEFYFDVIPGNMESAHKGVFEQKMAMDMPYLRHVHKRMVNISDLNEELTLYMSERLDKQDRIVEAALATREAAKAENENWTKRLAYLQSINRNYRDEAIRLKHEHLTNQTKSQLLEERNEALQLEIRSIVRETEELQRRRDAFEKNMYQDKEEILAKAGELAKENKKAYQSLAALKAELNDLKIGLLNDEEEESKCGEDMDESDTVVKETCAVLTKCVRTDVDIDLNNIGCHEPGTDSPRFMTNDIHNPKGNRTNCILDTNEDTLESKGNISIGKKLQHTRKVESEAKFHELNNQTLFEKEKKGKLLELSVDGLYLDNYQVSAGMNISNIMPDVLHITTESGDSGVKASQTQQVDRRLPCYDKISEATNLANKGGSILNAETKPKQFIRDTCNHSYLTMTVPKTDENIKQKHISLAIRPKTGRVKRFVPLPTTSELSIPSLKKSIQVSSLKTRITDKSSKVKTAHRAVTHVDSKSNVLPIKKQLPFISRYDIKRKTKQCLEMYSIYMVNALPSISPQKPTTENSVICDVRVSSPRPLFTTRTDSTCKVRPSYDKAETSSSIKPSLGKVDTTGNTKPSLGKVDTSRYTVPSLSKRKTTYSHKPSLDKLETTYDHELSLGKKETSNNLKPSLDKGCSTYNLKSSIGKTCSKINITPSLGKGCSTYNPKSSIGKTCSKINLTPSTGKADTTYNIKTLVESGDNRTPKTSSVEVKACDIETNI